MTDALALLSDATLFRLALDLLFIYLHISVPNLTSTKSVLETFISLQNEVLRFNSSFGAELKAKVKHGSLFRNGSKVAQKEKCIFHHEGAVPIFVNGSGFFRTIKYVC